MDIAQCYELFDDLAENNWKITRAAQGVLLQKIFPSVEQGHSQGDLLALCEKNYEAFFKANQKYEGMLCLFLSCVLMKEAGSKLETLNKALDLVSTLEDQKAQRIRSMINCYFEYFRQSEGERQIFEICQERGLKHLSNRFKLEERDGEIMFDVPLDEKYFTPEEKPVDSPVLKQKEEGLQFSLLQAHCNKINGDLLQAKEGGQRYACTKMKHVALMQLIHDLLKVKTSKEVTPLLKNAIKNKELISQRYCRGRFFRVVSFGLFKSKTEALIRKTLQESCHASLV